LDARCSTSALLGRPKTTPTSANDEQHLSSAPLGCPLGLASGRLLGRWAAKSGHSQHRNSHSLGRGQQVMLAAPKQWGEADFILMNCRPSEHNRRPQQTQACGSTSGRLAFLLGVDLGPLAPCDLLLWLRHNNEPVGCCDSRGDSWADSWLAVVGQLWATDG